MALFDFQVVPARWCPEISSKIHLFIENYVYQSARLLVVAGTSFAVTTMNHLLVSATSESGWMLTYLASVQ